MSLLRERGARVRRLSLRELWHVHLRDVQPSGRGALPRVSGENRPIRYRDRHIVAARHMAETS